MKKIAGVAGAAIAAAGARPCQQEARAGAAAPHVANCSCSPVPLECRSRSRSRDDRRRRHSPSRSRSRSRGRGRREERRRSASPQQNGRRGEGPAPAAAAAPPAERKPLAAGPAGGVYIPPFKLAQMMAEIEDKQSAQVRRGRAGAELRGAGRQRWPQGAGTWPAARAPDCSTAAFPYPHALRYCCSTSA